MQGISQGSNGGYYKLVDSWKWWILEDCIHGENEHGSGRQEEFAGGGNGRVTWATYRWEE